MPRDRFEHPEAPKPGKVWVPPKRTPREPEPPKRRAPRRFRALDVVTREVLLDDGSVAEMLEMLREVEHVNDVNLYVWEPEREGWRLLSMAEQRVVWERRLS